MYDGTLCRFYAWLRRAVDTSWPSAQPPGGWSGVAPLIGWTAPETRRARAAPMAPPQNSSRLTRAACYSFDEPFSGLIVPPLVINATGWAYFDDPRALPSVAASTATSAPPPPPWDADGKHESNLTAKAPRPPKPGYVATQRGASLRVDTRSSGHGRFSVGYLKTHKVHTSNRTWPLPCYLLLVILHSHSTQWMPPHAHTICAERRRGALDVPATLRMPAAQIVGEVSAVLLAHTNESGCALCALPISTDLDELGTRPEWNRSGSRQFGSGRDYLSRRAAATD